MTAADPVPLLTAPVVRPEPDTRLDQLLAEYAALKPQADEYAARLKTVSDGIKAELVERHPDQREILAAGSAGTTPLRLEAVVQWRLDTTKLKAARPEIYAAYARQSTSWRLSQLKG